jgi:hypothetical protein
MTPMPMARMSKDRIWTFANGSTWRFCTIAGSKSMVIGIPQDMMATLYCIMIR